MARQSRKGKNELDIILEQLKKSYGSDSSESLEDDLMMSSPSEEDSELNALLNTIFDSNSNTFPSENDNIADEDFESSDISLNEEETVDNNERDHVNNDTDVDSSVSSDEEQTFEDGNDNAEDISNDHSEDKAFEKSGNPDTYADEIEDEEDIEAEYSEPENDERIIEDTEDTLDESAQVDHVLDLMFHHGSDSNDEDFKYSLANEDEENPASRDDESNFSVEEYDEGDPEADADEIVEDSIEEDIRYVEEQDIEDHSESEIYDNDSDIDLDESDDYFIDDEDNISFDTLYENYDESDDGHDGNTEECPDEDLQFAIEDEEYDVSSDADYTDTGSIYSYSGFNSNAVINDDSEELVADSEKISEIAPAPVLVLTQDKYTYDPLQNYTPSFNLPGYEELVEESSDTQSNTASLAMIDNASFDNNDISLLLKLGYDNEIKAKVGEEKTQEIVVEQENSFKHENHNKPFGYCGNELFNRDQCSKIKDKYRSSKISAIIMLTVLSVISALLLSIDIFYIFFSARIEFFPVALAFEFVFIVLIGLLLHHKILSGISKVFKFEADSSALPVFLGFVYLIYLIVALLVYLVQYPSFNTSELVLCGFCLSIYAVLDAVSDLLNCIRESNAFNIIDSSNELFAAEKQAPPSRNDAGKQSDNETTYKIQKVNLISGYFKRSAKKPAGKISIIFEFGILPAIALANACAVTLVSNSIMAGLAMLMMTLLLGVPLASVFIFSLYEFITSKWLAKSKTAFIGYDAAEEYSKANRLIFSDSDAVTITSLTEIVPGKSSDPQLSLDIAYDVFKTLNGPMSRACEEHAVRQLNDGNPLIINEISDNGIDLYYNNAMNILIGDKYYMKAHKIKVKIDTNLSTAAKGIDRSVVFMAFDGVPKLGFIINSKINNDFVSIALALEKVHVRSKVATFEPQINDIYFEQNVGHNGSFVSVLKQSNYEPPRPDKICKSGIVSATNSISVAKAILLSHEISAYRKHFRLINRLVMAGGLVVAVALSILYCLGSYYSVSPEILGYTVTAFYTAEFLGTIPCAIKLTSAHLKHVHKNNGDTKQK